MVATVLVCSDGSDLAIDAARAGLALLLPAARVVVAAVTDKVDPLEGAGGHAGPIMTDDEVAAQHDLATVQAEAALTATVRALVAAGVADADTERRLLDGQPGPALCGLATELEADAIVIGSRGRGGLKRALLGSVSDYVVRNAGCPVLVTRSSG
jgi:nucleotide-binding universal stress UspA family protein